MRYPFAIPRTSGRRQLILARVRLEQAGQIGLPLGPAIMLQIDIAGRVKAGFGFRRQ